MSFLKKAASALWEFEEAAEATETPPVEAR